MSTESMIERVARAICGANCFRAKLGGEPCINADHTNGPCKANATQLALGGPMTTARLALAAMREPTEAMKTAAYGPILNGGRGGPITSDHIRREASLVGYRCMIDAAISQSGET